MSKNEAEVDGDGCFFLILIFLVMLTAGAESISNKISDVFYHKCLQDTAFQWNSTHKDGISLRDFQIASCGNSELKEETK